MSSATSSRLAMRSGVYHPRPKSKAVARKGALKRIAGRDEVAELIKLGKMLEKPVRGKFRR